MASTARDRRKVELKGVTPILKAPARWSHQDELASLVGKQIIIFRDEVAPLACELLAADQFTLKIKMEVDGLLVGVTIFKHALASYAAVPPEMTS